MLKSEVHLIDCVEFMRGLPDNYFSLSLVDPPYGIEWDGANDILKRGRPDMLDRKNNPKYKEKSWDEKIPTEEYFYQLLRVSKNQVIWGGNYFTDYLSPKKCWIFWDKLFDKTFNFSHGELAWTSLDSRMLKVVMSSKLDSKGGADKIHPCQKPIELYRWLLHRFAKPNDTIFDSHMGSQSSRIACHMEGFDFTGCELDPEYFEQGNQRYESFLKTYGTPDPTKAIQGQQINLF